MGSAIVSAVFTFVRAALFTASAAGTYGVVANIVAGVKQQDWLWELPEHLVVC